MLNFNWQPIHPKNHIPPICNVNMFSQAEKPQTSKETSQQASRLRGSLYWLRLRFGDGGRQAWQPSMQMILKRNASTAQAAQITAEANLVVAKTAQANAENQKATAVANENEAKRQAQIALARQWAADANAILASPNGNAETAALLSVRALQLQQDVYVPSADEALNKSLN